MLFQSFNNFYDNPYKYLDKAPFKISSLSQFPKRVAKFFNTTNFFPKNQIIKAIKEKLKDNHDYEDFLAKLNVSLRFLFF